MSDRAALEAGIVARPDDDTARLVFADWLDEHDEPLRAEFIRLQIEWERAERFSAPWLNLVGRMSALAKADPREFDAEPVSRLAPVPFRRGFTEAVRFTVGRILDSGWHWYERTPVRVAHLVATNEPMALFEPLEDGIPVERLTGLEVTAGYTAHRVSGLLNAWGDRARGLRAFGFTNGSYTGAQFNGVLGAFAPGQLAALSVAGGRPIFFQSMPLAQWNWPSNLKWLDLSNIEIHNGLADQLAACKFRRAETVRLSGEAHRYPFLQLRLGDVGLRRVLEAGTFPAVRRLDVSGQDLGPESLRALIDRGSSLALEELRFARNRLNVETDDEEDDFAPLTNGGLDAAGALGQIETGSLRVLDLSGQQLGEPGAHALAFGARMPNLCVLIVRDCGLKPSAVRALRKQFPCVLAGDAEDLTHVPAFFEVWP
jgi:uncharacterized protein (TIGR02996 family)